MTKALWILPSIILWLLQKSNAGPVMSNKNHLHYTNIGDIPAKDIVDMVDEATPADKRFLSTDQMEDSDENIETERNQYYQNDHPDLDSPNDQELKFVHFLKKHYKGTFPEYNKETKADYAQNKELDENLNVQPDTVFLGHSDMYKGKNGGNEDIGDVQSADVDPSMDNLDTFDSDANLLNSFNMGGFHAKINNTTEAPFRTTARRHRNEEHLMNDEKEIENELNAENYDLNDDGDGDDDATDASGTTGDEDEHLSTDEEQEGTYEVPQKAQKTEDQMVADTEETTPLKILQEDDKKTKNTKKKNKKVKLNKDGSSNGILEEFDDLKGHNKNTQKEHAGIEGDSKQIAGTMSKKPSPKHQPESKSGKKINYIHAEDSQGTNDAILDFLDKLLEKDPKKLRHDVLTMAKAMKNEETKQSGRASSSAHGNQDSNPSESENTEIKHRVKDEDGSLRKNIDDGKQVEKWILELEDKKGAEKEAISQIENGYSFDDEEYNEYHELPEIYPDHNADGETTLSESVYDGLGDEKEKNEGKESDKAEEIKDKEQEFDYEEFKEEALKMHNEFRKRHNAVALQWSEELAKKANDIAEQLTSATRNSFKRELEKHGQSIAILPHLTKHIAKTAVQKWYSEITKFSFANPEVKPETRDFTQIIWSGSKRLGMGFAHSANKKKTLVVALYSPAGNSPEEMRKNLNMVNYDLYADIRKTAIGRHG